MKFGISGHFIRKGAQKNNYPPWAIGLPTAVAGAAAGTGAVCGAAGRAAGRAAGAGEAGRVDICLMEQRKNQYHLLIRWYDNKILWNYCMHERHHVILFTNNDAQRKRKQNRMICITISRHWNIRVSFFKNVTNSEKTFCINCISSSNFSHFEWRLCSCVLCKIHREISRNF